MSLINSEINFIITWSNICFIIDNPIVVQETRNTIAATKICIPVVTLSTQDNAKPLKKLKSGFKEQLTGINMNWK